jgi:hypothetical protein
VPPSLLAWLDGQVWLRLDPPRQIAPRAWALGVVAMQIQALGTGVTARARAHTTGGSEPVVRPLTADTVLHVAFVDADDSPPAPPAPLAPEILLPDHAASLTVLVDGTLLEQTWLARAAQAAMPAPRAFGHAFCRWLRDGSTECGFDLTDFLSRPPGAMFERRVVATVQPGQEVTFVLRAAAFTQVAEESW